jgi:signal transduction histidine kinase
MSVLATLRARRQGWLDPALAAGLFAALEIDLISTSHRRGPILLDGALIAAMTVPTVWRRRAPLEYASVVMVSAGVLIAVSDLMSNLFPAYVMFVPAYAVAAYESRTRALIGLAVCVCGSCVMTAQLGSSSPTDYLWVVGLCGATWIVGRALRARRILALALEGRVARLTGEREDRARLAVAEERTRIARELHAVVANNVTTMIVQTELAQRLLAGDPTRADEAMAAVEETGRQALSEMRRILGVLRRDDELPALAPQPGVGQIHALVERTRGDGQHVELRVEGEPGPLPASVDLGVYRILEETLLAAGDHATRRFAVMLRFGERDIELQVSASGGNGPLDWPTPAMRQRLALSEGVLETEITDDGIQQLLARMPRAFDGALA